MTRQTSSSVMTCRDVQERIDRYLDLDLPPGEGKVLEAHLRICGSCRAEFEVAEAVETRLRNAFRDEVPTHQLWSRIVTDLRTEESVARHVGHRPYAWRPTRRTVIAASLLLAFGTVLSERWLTTTDIDAAELMQTPVDELRSFVDSGRPLDVATADPAQLRAWFVSKIDFPPPTPPTVSDLSLVGGRLCYFFRRRIAAYMYHGDGHALSLYIMSDRDLVPPSRRDVMLGSRMAAVREFDGFAHVLWREGKLYYSLVSDQPSTRLVQVAQAIATSAG